ncbi:MAG: right-handed parallel beta-helix repeat-containing protein, partial [Planctomycetes bacterium]|nr:right-handed parallel beta-helix repeat-containing protein [Planctomycetota bacterium]
MIALLLLGAHAVAADHAVLPDAADGSGGALVAAAARAGSADRLILARGGVYRVPDGLEFRAGVTVAADGPAALPPPLLTTSVVVPALTPWAKNAKVLTAKVDRPVLECYVGGRFLIQARYPNHGWLRAQKGSTPDLLVVADAGVTGTARWSGAQVRWRRWSWWWETRPITADDGKGQLTLGADGRFADGFTGIGSAFCIDNCLAELDAPGEWVWDRASSTLYVYPPEDAAPRAPVEVVLDTKGFQCSGATLDGIAFGRIAGTALRVGRKSVVTGCTFSDIGADAISATFDAGGTRIAGCTFRDVRNVAVTWIENQAGPGGTVIEGNRFERIGMQFGYGGSGAWHAAGVIIMAGKGVVVRGNRFVDIGYAGVLLGAAGQVVERNVLVRCMGSLNDGAAIYANCSESVIRDNIVLDCIGNLDTSHPWYPLGHGIWPEFLSDFHDQVITGNTVFGCGGNGLFLTNNYHCRVADNVFVGNRAAGLHLSGKKNVQDNTFTGNVLGAMDPPRLMHLIENIPADWKGSDSARCIEAEDGTQYGRMSGTTLVASPSLPLVTMGGRRADDAASWQQFGAWADAGARVERATILLLINDTEREHAFPTPAGGWSLCAGGAAGKTIRVAPFRSAVLV